MRGSVSLAAVAALFGLAACGASPTSPTTPADDQTGALTPVVAVSFAQTTSDGQPPRPGCGYGDDNHDHQAAPGLDPLNLRPGKGKGDPNHMHTAPPGQAPDDGGADTSVRRGCKADPRGR